MYFVLYPCFITSCFLITGFEVNLSLQLLHSGIFFFGLNESRTLSLHPSEAFQGEAEVNNDGKEVVWS